MSAKKQTAVEWLVEQFDLEMFDSFHLTKINQAKAMEKEQIKDAWCTGNDSEPKEVSEYHADQYYIETYGE